MALDVQSYEDEQTILKVEDNTVFIEGVIDRQNPKEILFPFFDSVHSQIVNNQVKVINVDIRKLRFLNSSGIKEFISWIMKLNSLADDQKYKIIFICNPDISWQSTSMSSVIMLNMKWLEKKEIQVDDEDD